VDVAIGSADGLAALDIGGAMKTVMTPGLWGMRPA
jgi:hypothetical protein